MFGHTGSNMDQVAPKKPSPYPGIGARIKAHRARLQKTQFELAAVVGVKPLAISEWETEAATPKLGHLASLAAALGCSLRELTGSDLFADGPAPTEAA
jgi:transcriptional regulator with XRE-family HTH domain